jgi:pyridinium-3,5-bisthiocarboxylic acid mononucleotide nickel chelatase
LTKIAYFDCFSGASGDMMLGALLDLGMPLDGLRSALGSLEIEYGAVSADRVIRAGISATKFRATAEERDKGEAHHHHHHLKHIVAAIERSALSRQGKDRASGMFNRLGEAEAAIHNTSLERVHLHEVGALDSIIDIVGAVYGMEWLQVDRILSSPLNVGSGTIECAHGTYPVPAPATARLLKNVPVYAGDVTAELVTPTGALIVTEYAERFERLPSMRVQRIGYGAGDKDFKQHPNVLRILVGDTDEGGTTEQVVVMECEIDDMNPQLFGPLMDRLHAAGALDVYYASVQMKKNRPGTLVTVLAPPSLRASLAGILFAETTTIGVRYQEVQRECLAREVRTVDTSLGPIRFKIATRDGRVLNASPEFDDCARIAAARGVPIKEVQAIATKAWLDANQNHAREPEPRSRTRTLNLEP